jgi:hypothetical protein
MSIPRNTPQTVQDVPILQWASGHTQARSTPSARFAPFVGFHSEQGKPAPGRGPGDSELDAACAAAGVESIEIRHPRPGGFEVKPHWSFGEAIRFHPVTAGPPATTISGCLRLADQTAAAGIGLLWQPGEKSRLAVRGLLLVDGVPFLVQLSVRSTMTGFLLAALLDHYRVCDTADSIIDRGKHPEMVALHELALPLVAGPEQAAGKGETTAQITPLISGHPAELDRAYVSSCWRSKAIHEAALASWPGLVVWAAGYRSGETNGDSHLDQPAEEAPQRQSFALGVKGRPRMAKLKEVELPL